MASKARIRFGAFDILLCVILAALAGLNVYAYTKDIEPNSETAVESYDGLWRMNLFITDDPNYDTYFCEYELDVTLTGIVRDTYRMDFTTAGAFYADGSTDGLVELEGTAMGLLDGDTLTFALPDVDSVMIHMTFQMYEGELVGVAYEEDAVSYVCYAIEMYRQ